MTLLALLSGLSTKILKGLNATLTIKVSQSQFGRRLDMSPNPSDGSTSKYIIPINTWDHNDQFYEWQEFGNMTPFRRSMARRHE